MECGQRLEVGPDLADKVIQNTDQYHTRLLVTAGPSYKNALQNYLQGRGLKLPEYKAITQPNGKYMLILILTD